MRKIFHNHPLFVKIVVPFLVASFVFALSQVTARNYAEGAFVNWEFLGTPPETLESFQAAMFEESVTEASIVIETQIEFYRGSQSLCEFDGNCWEQVEFMPGNISSGQFHVSNKCLSNYDKMDEPPGVIISCATYVEVAAGSHLVRDAYFAMLDDGTIWTWQFVPGSGALLIIILGSVISILIAFAMLAGVKMMYRVRQNQTKISY